MKMVKFAFITGCDKISLHAHGNKGLGTTLGLVDISHDENFSELCGFTEEEVKHHYAEYITRKARHCRKSNAEIFEDVKNNYNGYRFTAGGPLVYNPISVLTYFYEYFECVPISYWVKTHDPPENVVKQMVREQLASGSPTLVHLEHRFTGAELYDRYDRTSVSNNQPVDLYDRTFESVLFRHGYLTIDHKEGDLSLIHISEPTRPY